MKDRALVDMDETGDDVTLPHHMVRLHSTDTVGVSQQRYCVETDAFRCIFDPPGWDPGWKKSISGIQDPGIFENLVQFFGINSLLHIRIRDPLPFLLKIRDPGWKNSDTGSGSATLVFTNWGTESYESFGFSSLFYFSRW
jgi:hypothetical protein